MCVCGQASEARLLLPLRKDAHASVGWAAGFIIGRLGADLSLTSGYVSRKHAQLQRTATGWRVLDTSTNGLCVNNVRALNP